MDCFCEWITFAREMTIETLVQSAGLKQKPSQCWTRTVKSILTLISEASHGNWMTPSILPSARENDHTQIISRIVYPCNTPCARKLK
ncbi:hypothetical protein ANRL1_03060 [Anaerolineae bacterium]|nr:hypothetical protein ANRL1_03060 [Anaerolineae bacterium]